MWEVWCVANIVVLGVALVYFLVFLLLAGLVERYIPDSVWDKLDRLFRFSKEVREDESD